MNGDDRQLRNGVLVAVAMLIASLCAVVLIALDDNERSILEGIGMPVAPAPDRSKAGASVRAGDIQPVRISGKLPGRGVGPA